MNTSPTIPSANTGSHPNPALRGILAALSLTTAVVFFIIYWMIAPSGGEGAVNLVVLMFLLVGIVVLSASALSIKSVSGAVIGWSIVYILGFGGLIWVHFDQKRVDAEYDRKVIEQNQVSKAEAERLAQEAALRAPKEQADAVLGARRDISLTECSVIGASEKSDDAWRLCVANNFNTPAELSVCLQQAANHTSWPKENTPSAYCYGQLAALEGSDKVCLSLSKSDEQQICATLYQNFIGSHKIYPGAKPR